MVTTALGEREGAVVRSVSRERLMEDTRAIARWVRLSGSEEERQSFEWVADTLRALGVEPTLYLAPAYISLPGRAELTVDAHPIEAITHSMAVSTDASGLRAPLVSVGTGSAADYASHDVRGRIALIDGIASPEAVLRAQLEGAAGCVFANSDQHVHEMIVSTVWGSPTPETRGFLPRIPAASVGRDGAKTLRSLLARGESVEAHLVTRVSTSWREIPTLVAQVDPPSGAETFVLLSGHIDSWHYGAMDNGSANAAMLETLRAVLPHRDTFRRSLRLAFWSGHSHGRYAGSTWYADTFWEELFQRCAVHINVDSLGGRNAVVLTEANAMAETKPVAAEVIGAVTGEAFRGTRFGRAGDQSFQGIGVSSLFMSLSEQPPDDNATSGLAAITGAETPRSGGLGWWWHTTEDTVDKIDPDLLLRDAQIYAGVTYRFLASAVLPLDLRASAQELHGHLRFWQERVGDRFDLYDVVARAEEVATLADRFQARLDALQDVDEAAARRLDEAILRIERPLVRLNYARSGAFGHDPGLGQPPVPLLEPIAALIEAEPGSERWYELETLLRRRRNQVMFDLAEARRALREGLAEPW